MNDISRVTGKGNLELSFLTVSYAEDVADETIRARLERAGYRVK